MNRKKKWFIILGIILLLSIGVIVLQETGVINKHVYIRVNDLTEKEEVSYNNLLFSLNDLFLDEDSQILKSRHLCIFNTGDVYYLELPQKLLWLSNSNEYLWEKAENVVYMGRLSNSSTETLNQYVENYDDDEKYIIENIDRGFSAGYDPFTWSFLEAKATSSSDIRIY